MAPFLVSKTSTATMVLGSGVSSSSSGSRSVTRSGKKNKSKNPIFAQKRQPEIHLIHVKKQALKTRSKMKLIKCLVFRELPLVFKSELTSL